MGGGAEGGKRKERGGAKLVVMISGGGRTLVSLCEAIERGGDGGEGGEGLDAEIVLVIASRECAGAERARALGLRTVVEPGEVGGISAARLAGLIGEAIGEGKGRGTGREEGGGQGEGGGEVYVVLAGYLKKVNIPESLRWRVVNIHPALLPAFGGPGMFGDRVHAAVIEAGCRVSGCTVHLCDEEYDRGPILVQRACEVKEGDTAATLGARVFAEEKIAYVEALRMLIEGRVRVERSAHGYRARIVEGSGE